MSRFFVGQRVRILFSEGWPELAGETGTIEASRVPIAHGADAGSLGWPVAPDAWCSSRPPCVGVHGAVRLACPERNLQPLYDGNQAVSWETCAWRPTEDASA